MINLNALQEALIPHLGTEVYQKMRGNVNKLTQENGRLKERINHLNGLIISTKSFPGWKSFSALLSHLSFVKDHHKKIAFIAFVTDSPIGSLAEHAARHLVSAKIKSFEYSEIDSAKKWIIESHAK